MSKMKIFAGAIFLSIATAGWCQSGPVRVVAWGQHYGGQLTYSYEVQNLGTSPIKRVMVGLASSPSYGFKLLMSPTLQGDTTWISADGCRAPQGWGARIQPQDEKATFAVEWIEASYLRQLSPTGRVRPEAPAVVPGVDGILPGTSINSFAVIVPEPDFAYVSGDAQVTVGATTVSTPVIKGDTVAPVVSLDVTRVNQNGSGGTWAIFKVTVGASDNFDPQPEVVFAPVTADQPVASGDISVDKNSNQAWNVRVKNVTGRTYIFTATATDASGNVGSGVYRYAVGR